MPGRSAPWALWGGVAWESALLFGLYALWQFAGSFTVMGTSGALPRGRWLWDAERVLHLPSETALQRLVLPHPLLVQASNLYYDILHFPLLGACLIWLYARHRADYPRIRTTVAAFTGISLLIQLIPVAPPRLLASTGMVAGRLSGPSMMTPWTTTRCPGSVSAQFPPASAARSTITEPGRMAATISALSRTGARAPGIIAVVMTTSASRTASRSNSRSRA